MNWTRPRPAPAAAVDDLFEDVASRTRARSEDAAAGWLELVHQREHPLVQAALRSGRPRRHALTTALVAAALGISAAVFSLAFRPELGPLPGWVAGLFVCLWPTVCFLGAGLTAGAAVIDERERGTAMQLVLTPLGKRPIAASKVLPALLLFLPAAAAALPAYLPAASARPFLEHEVLPTPMVLWPLRLLAPVAGFEAPEAHFMAIPTGLAMWAVDLAAVWAAAHWGAAYGVRLGSLPLVAAALLWRTVLTALYLVGVMLVIALVVSVLFAALGCLFSVANLVGWLFLGALVLAGMWYLFRCCRRYFVSAPVRAVLYEFTHFDDLAMDDYRPRPLRGWEIIRFYGERT
jgi:hypothetical protein